MNKKLILITAGGVMAAAGLAVALLMVSGNPARQGQPAPVSVPAAKQTSVQTLAKPDVLEKTGGKKISQNFKAPGTEPADVSGPLPETAAEAEENLYYETLVFRDEALATFPVHTVDIHIPEALVPRRWDNAGRSIPYPNPKKNEIWIRVKPGNRADIKEIMAQTADLYRQYVGETGQDIRVINWLGYQPHSVVTYDPDGNEVRNPG